jgi:hypothetical protein
VKEYEITRHGAQVNKVDIHTRFYFKNPVTKRHMEHTIRTWSGQTVERKWINVILCKW